MRIKINEILDFWFVETPDEKKFKKDLKFDQVIKNKFLNDYELAIQNKLIIDKQLVLRGPNTDSLRDGYRYDDCHFNSRGLSKLSELWHQSITLKSEQ